MDPMFIVGAVANFAGLVTFVDWAVIRSRAKKQKKPLDQSLKALDKLEISLREISTAVKEKKNLLEVKHYVDLLYEAKADLLKDLREIGIEIPREELPQIRGASGDTLLTMIGLCESGIHKAKNELTMV